MAIAVYPGTFNPPTVAHLAIAAAARRQGGLERVDFVVSQVPLGKEDLTCPTIADRLEVLARIVASRPWLAVRATSAQLLADVAAGYDAVILGADKWAQIVDPAWYGGSEEARDAALARLPRVLVAPRPPFPLPRLHTVLDIEVAHGAVSSTAVRSGRRDWMLPEAAEFDERTGAWSDPDRYRAERETHRL